MSIFSQRSDIEWEEENRYALWSTGYGLDTDSGIRVPYICGNMRGADMSKRGPYANLKGQLTREEERDIYQSDCRDCKGGPFVEDSDCPEWCDNFARAAREMIEGRDE